ncbi:MAG: TlpA disulfide reductase family protein [Candidatus Margulisiibacteriota bacterium]
MKKLISCLLLALTALVLAAAAETAPQLGSVAPALALPDLNGKTTTLQRYAGEKPVIVVFFTSWSKSCQAELADLQALYNHKFEILAVSFDKKSKELKSFLAKNPLSYPVLLDKKLASLDAFQVLIIPTTFCVNRDGEIEKLFVDYDDNVKLALTDWLAQ